METIFINRNQIPLLDAEPLDFVFRAPITPGTLQIGEFDWTLNNSKVFASPQADLDPTHIYAIESFSFSADIEQVDYQSAINSTTAPSNANPGVPRFSLYVQSEGSGPILLQPIPLAQYYEESTYTKWKVYSKSGTQDVQSNNATGRVSAQAISFLGAKKTNQFQGAFEARLDQIPSLAGKTVINLIMVLKVLDIRNQAFIEAYKAQGKQGLTIQKGGLRG